MSDPSCRVLVVDDDPSQLRLLSKWLEAAGYEVTRATDGQEAITAIQRHAPHILVADWEMPRIDGLELCRWLRQQDLATYVYTLIVTCHSSSADMVAALEAGADDFLRKPINKPELLARVRSGLRILELERRLNARAQSDPLTGLATRRAFLEQLEREWSRSCRSSIPLSCVMLDIDFFKRINDTFGHRAGDQVLRDVATVLSESCRGGDFVGRYGGEEFCLLLPETTEENAVLGANRVRQRIAAMVKVLGDDGHPVTASFGVAQRRTDTQGPEELIDLADQALLIAKRTGRDRVTGFQSLASSAGLLTNAAGPGAMFQGLTARQVMTTVVAGLHQDDTAGIATQFFLQWRLNSAPVVDDVGQLVGILSEHDVMSIMLWPQWWLSKIRDVMKRNAVCYDEGTPVLTIYEFLSRVSIRGVVIVNDRRPTGVIDRSSLLRWFTNRLAVSPDVPAEELPCSDPSIVESGLPLDSRLVAQQIACTLRREAEELERRITLTSDEWVPSIVGGVSRIEDLINDLLAFTRHVNLAGHVQHTDATTVTPPVVGVDAAGSQLWSPLDYEPDLSTPVQDGRE